MTSIDARIATAVAPSLGDSQVERHARAAQTEHRDAILRRMLAVADVASAAGALALLDSIAGRRLSAWNLVAIPAMLLLAKILGRYDAEGMTMRRSTLDEIPALLSISAFWVVVWSLLGLVVHEPILALRTGGAGALFVFTAVLLIATRTVARSLARATTSKERVLIVGSSAGRAQLAGSLGTDPTARIDVVGFLPLEDERTADLGRPDGCRRQRRRTFADLRATVDELAVDRVLLIPSSADNELMLEAITEVLALGLEVSIVPRMFEVVGSAVSFDTVGGVTVLGVRRARLNRSSRALKRALDIAGASTALVFGAPLLVLIAAAVKLDSPGPVFFRQPRVGRGGHHFALLKFRSMVVDADARRSELRDRNETSGLFKIADDPRVTRVGRIIRALSLDELPQIINVLNGDMSLVGPRPLVIDEDALVLGRHRRRLTLSPGMTGPWQVLGPTRPPLSEMVKTDYVYATNWSLWTDVKILLRTVAHVGARRNV